MKNRKPAMYVVCDPEHCGARQHDVCRSCRAGFCGRRHFRRCPSCGGRLVSAVRVSSYDALDRMSA